MQSGRRLQTQLVCDLQWFSSQVKASTQIAPIVIVPVNSVWFSRYRITYNLQHMAVYPFKWHCFYSYTFRKKFTSTFLELGLGREWRERKVWKVQSMTLLGGDGQYFILLTTYWFPFFKPQLHNCTLTASTEFCIHRQSKDAITWELYQRCFSNHQRAWTKITFCGTFSIWHYPALSQE